MFKKFLIFFSILVLISACGGKKAKNNQSSSAGQSNQASEAELNFPDSQYLTAKGSGSSQPEAKRNAKSEISSIFEAKVSSDLSSSATQVTDTKKGDSFNKTVKHNVRIQSSVELKGLEIGKTWKEGSTHFALAVLEKSKARKEWASQIDSIDNKIDAELKAVETAGSKVQKLRPLKKIQTLWFQKEGIISRLRVIGSSNPSSANHDIKGIFKKIPEIKSQILFHITVNGEFSDDVQEIIAKSLGKSSFKITDNPSEADVKIDGKVSNKQVKNNNKDFIFSRSKIALSLIDTVDGSQIGEIKEDSRKSALNYEEASHKAVKSVSSKSVVKLLEYFD